MIMYTRRDVIVAVAAFWAAVVLTIMLAVGGCATAPDMSAIDIHDACSVEGGTR
jgi:hypothetical protein